MFEPTNTLRPTKLAGFNYNCSDRKFVPVGTIGPLRIDVTVTAKWPLWVLRNVPQFTPSHFRCFMEVQMDEKQSLALSNCLEQIFLGIQAFACQGTCRSENKGHKGFPN